MRLITLLSALEKRPLSVYIVEARTKVSDASIGATEWPPSIEDIEISGIAYDSREVGPGGLFVAVPGFHTDGRKFLAEAVQGAQSLRLVSRYSKKHYLLCRCL